MLVCEPGAHCLVTDGRYDSFVRDAIRQGAMAPLELERVEARYDDALACRVRQRGLTRCGFEAEHVTVATLGRWRETAPWVDWVPTSQAVEHLRLVKDAAELEVLRRGGRALSEVARMLRDWVVPGRSEREIAVDLDQGLQRAGFERPAFDTIVAAGPNSAYPHARPTDRRLARGDLVVLDFGGVLDGYCVDLTRMAGIGQIESDRLRLFTAVREAQDAARSAIRAGVKGAEVDAAARQVLEARGLGAAFVHGTGHGLGLEVHEGPRLSRLSTGPGDLLEAGMVCTVEPGVYVEGLGGVRLEDDVVVTTGGSELLTDAPRDLLVV